MSELIKVRCPKCNEWCSIEKTDKIEKVIKGLNSNKAAGLLLMGAGGLLGGVGVLLGAVAAPLILIDENTCECPHCKSRIEIESTIKETSGQYELSCEIKKLQEDLFNNHIQHKGEFLENVQGLLAQVEKNNGNKRDKASLHNIIAYCYYSFFNDNSKALAEINKSLDLFNDPQAHVLKGIFMHDVANPEENYKKMEELLHLTECKNSIYIDKSIVEKELADIQDRYAENFTQIPPHQRKFLAITQEYKRLSNNLKVLRFDDFNKTKLTIPAGFVSKDTLYVCHPYKPNSYYPSTSYQTDLFEDQINELRELLQCLGAKSITTENARSNQKGLETEQGFGGEVGGKYKGVGGNLGVNHQNKQATAESIIQKKLINDEFEFNPDMSPFVPEGLFWFTHMGEWQRLARMRLRGQNKLDIVISEQQTHVVSNNEATQVNADFNTIVAAGHVQVSHNSAFQQSENSSKDFKLVVEFYPLSEYKKSSLLTNNLLSASSLQSDKATNNAKNSLLLYALFAIIGILTIIIMFFIL